jgi:hypothetical protein
MRAKYQKGLTLVAFCLALVAVLGPRACAETEAQRVVARLLAPPTIKTELGFTAKILVPPGQLYDPLFPFIRDCRFSRKSYCGDDAVLIKSAMWNER